MEPLKTKEILLLESFDKPGLNKNLAWFNPPLTWQTGNGSLRVETDGETDFWQRTHYGFQADNGHFLYTSIPGDFRLTTELRFQPRNQYDQSGLMVRLSPDCWLKMSVEYEPDGPAKLGAVVTNSGYSDWSTQDFPADQHHLCFRVTRRANDYTVEFALPDASRDWRQIRVAHLREDDGRCPVQCGLYACSPKGPGYVTEFQYLRIERIAAEERETEN